jgi:protein-tyrosine phosphatase
MAEFVMKDMVEREGKGAQFTIASAATSREELGNPVYPPARRILLANGIDPAGKLARQVERGDYERYDYFIGMDAANVKNLITLFGGDPQGKVFRLLDRTKQGGDIADPWYSGDFEATWQDVQEGCRALLDWFE